MWIIKNKKFLFNLDKTHVITINKEFIQLFLSNDKSDFISWKYDSEQEAQQQFNYILEGLKRKEEVIYL